MEKNVWLYFNTEADDDNVGASTNCCFPAKNLVGMVPQADGALQLQFKSMRNHTSAATDTVLLTLSANNTHLDIMKTILRAINDTRPTFAGFKVVADDLTVIVGGAANSATAEYMSGQETGTISACGTIDVAAASNSTVTATVDGTGTGVIPGGGFYTVSSGNAAHWVTLPAPVPGTVVYLNTAADSTGFEIRSTAPGSVGINGGTGGSAESDIAAGVNLVRLQCVSATNWIGTQWVAAGTEAAITVAS
tara:strand:+ start:112 stop:858 length:747 start_codon:yes stop_codon:yes gene_type:complete